MGASRCDKDSPTAQRTLFRTVLLRPCIRVFAGEDLPGLREDIFRFRQPARPGIRPGELPASGWNNMNPAGLQHRNIFLSSRMLPHLGVHRRCHHHRALGHQQGIEKKVIGYSHTRLRDSIRSCRRDHNQVGFFSKANVRDFISVFTGSHKNGMMRQGFPRGGPDHLQGSRGRDNVHIRTGFHEEPDEVGRLIGGDTSGYADNDARRVFYFSSSCHSSLSSAISRSAMDRGFSSGSAETSAP